ncbi:MAG: hypothetical protein M3186_08740 [Actinomycetota bacterium]|nr:hypothetical protein [Actinomycetota bacterium]
MTEPAVWFLRSGADHDPHRGLLLPDGTVKAVCGQKFQPRPLAYGKLAFNGDPLDPEQICPQCRAKAVP